VKKYDSQHETEIITLKQEIATLTKKYEEIQTQKNIMEKELEGVRNNEVGLFKASAEYEQIKLTKSQFAELEVKKT